PKPHTPLQRMRNPQPPRAQRVGAPEGTAIPCRNTVCRCVSWSVYPMNTLGGCGSLNVCPAVAHRTHDHARTRTHTHACTHTRARTHTHTRAHAHTHAHAHTDTHTDPQTHRHTDTQTH